MKINGSQILIECLIEQGVDTVFGYPGGAVLNIYDALYKNSDRIKHILTAHEQGASHAADGYARATGKVGVCIATSGPGATNLVTGIATAYMDSVPMVAITGNVATPLLGKDSFQEVDISGITMPITKHNYIVKDINQLADTIREAFYIARSGRPGPVLIDIPKDITATLCEFRSKTAKEIQTQVDTIIQEDIDRAVTLIRASQKPLIYSGGGVIRSGAHEILLQFAEKIDAPVATSLMGIGGFPETHPLSTGLIGMHGSKASNYAATECDLMIALGARFSDRVISDVTKFAPHANILHIDIDPAEVGKNVSAYSAVVGDVKTILTTLTHNIPKAEHPEWVDAVKCWKEEFHFDYQKDETLRPQFIMENIYDQTDGEAIITTEVGQHQMWAAQFYKYSRPNTFLSSGGLGTMGYGTGASIGAQIGMPQKQVVHIAGDGSFRMNSNELSTIAHYNVPVIIVLMNNTTLGMVRQWQTTFYEARYSQTTLDRGPDFTLLAKAYGVKGYDIKTQEEFIEAFKEALQSKKPALLNCHIGMDEKVLPMVAPGAAINNLILE
ncbi:biosynthetic-type acetolactate synthase large subunit [Cellulosilyticum sp. I15G10I2]|uniref:biosynthetic-type acetolactate synthase large subunit n=1 Tax=Cellulosilyticum sp. I15G10I2 TaxID=1892843 RepID=UPI00085C037B|nr:biosynthetic-type acetolactate synthase large subunit [Cellulosilyticum sp. I15G10I2]